MIRASSPCDALEAIHYLPRGTQLIGLGIPHSKPFPDLERNESTADETAEDVRDHATTKIAIAMQDRERQG